MPLTLVGLGLGDADDITVRGLKAIKAADVVFLEAYTAVMCNSTQEQLEEIYGRPLTVADRDAVESGAVIEDVETRNIVLLVVGDPFSATTHSDLVVRCHQRGVKTDVVHNTSILIAVGQCGLQLYRYGQTLTLCFWTDTWRPDSWYPKLKENRSLGLHTLLLVDIKVKEVSDENLARGRMVYEPPRFMTVNQAAEQVLEVEAGWEQGAVSKDTLAVGVSRLGSPDQQIVAGTLEELTTVDFGRPLHSLIIPGKVDVCEEEHLSLYYTDAYRALLAAAKK